MSEATKNQGSNTPSNSEERLRNDTKKDENKSDGPNLELKGSQSQVDKVGDSRLEQSPKSSKLSENESNPLELPREKVKVTERNLSQPIGVKTSEVKDFTQMQESTKPKIGDSKIVPPLKLRQDRQAQRGKRVPSSDVKENKLDITNTSSPKIGDTRPMNNNAISNEVATKVEPNSRAKSTLEKDKIKVDSQGKRQRSRRGNQGGRQKVNVEEELDPASLYSSESGVSEILTNSVGRYLVCVHVSSNFVQLGVLEGRTLVEHYASRPSDDDNQIDGNIYLGRVKNVLPGMEAAFVDISTPKNAVLYIGDVRQDNEEVDTGEDGESRSSPDKGNNKDSKIEQVLKNGQLIICQVTKNPIGVKGARLTQDVSLAGRYVVLVPGTNSIGISKRLDESERRRIKKSIDKIKPEGFGLIVRTAASGTSVEDLERDIKALISAWRRVEEKASKANSPTLLYREPQMALRVLRENINSQYRAVLIDDLELFREVKTYIDSFNPDLANRVLFYDKTKEVLPIFERFHIHEQLHKALARQVWLPSGGSLIIDHAEALTVIDVNTSKNVGSSNLEETVYQNNLEAADEVARQLRLRDIGGIIVIDFIDMSIKQNRTNVISAFRTALSRDRTRTQAFDISDLGLVEMTRKRVSEGLVDALSHTCPECNGRGIIFETEMS